MKLQFWSVGKNHAPYEKEAIELFTERISNNYMVEWNIILTPRHAATHNKMGSPKKKEGEVIIDFLDEDNYLVLMDEKGKKLPVKN
jgi:23S rRNA (pseudouridine1915-N3)-methyltransferase